MSTAAKQGRQGWRAGVLRFLDKNSTLIHLALFALAFFLTFGIYYRLKAYELWFHPFFVPLVLPVVCIKALLFGQMGLLRVVWRHIGMRDLWPIIKATTLATCGFIVGWFLLSRFTPFFEDRPQFPQSAFPLDWATTFVVVCGARVLVRFWNEEFGPRPETNGDRSRCLIVGAGDVGVSLLREILRSQRHALQVVGFLDDDPAKRRSRIHDTPVLGSLAEAGEVCRRYEVREILIAITHLPPRRLREIVKQCEDMSLRFRTASAFDPAALSRIRDVDIRDLLGREQVRLDEARISRHIRNQRVLVTGAGGSIGSELCRQIARFGPAKLILVEQAENNLFEIDRELAAAFPDVLLAPHVADICDARRIDQLLRLERPALIFHAAAHKHVPMMESNVGEAVKNNILGTKTVADAAKKANVPRFVMISTDKAVNPTSIMGCSKRVAEMYIQQLRQGGQSQFMTVRFGNVLGSSGSVIPIFRRQIEEGGPVTVTDPRMTRYFMTISEASQLVLQAGVMGSDGDIFVLDMGEPVKIVDLAREMITLSGLRPGEDIEIRFTSIRPGEKLFEELSVVGEDMGPTTHDKIYVWRNRKEDWPSVCQAIDELVKGVDLLPAEELRRKLAEIVPEYRSPTNAPSEPVIPGPYAAASAPHVAAEEPDAAENADSLPVRTSHAV